MIELSVILVEPKYPGNIGAVARACMNFGCKSLYLVNPVDYLVDEAFMFATHAKPLLYSAQKVSSLNDCFEDHDILVGTTRRRREKQIPFYSSKDLFPFIQHGHLNERGYDVTTPPNQAIKDKKRVRLGLVFGREDSGLTNDELSLCNVQACIPASEENSVFNLSQAVLIFLYDWFSFYQSQLALSSSVSKPEQVIGATEPYRWDLANKREEQGLYEKLAAMLSILPIDTRKGLDNFTGLFKRVFGRAILEKRDVRLFHKLFDLVMFLNERQSSK